MSHIFVEDYWGMRVEYHVTLSDLVHVLKQMIEERDGKLIAQQKLEYQGSELQDGDSLESYLISNNSIIQLSSNTLELLFVKMLTGKTLSFYIDLDAPVSQLQEMLNDKVAPHELQRLMFTNEQLVGHRPLSSYGIGKESTIHLVLLLRGGDGRVDQATAYAVVLHNWSGNMSHQRIKGLELVRGRVVVITSECSGDWYYGRVPNGTESRVFPRGYVRIIKNVHSQHTTQPHFRLLPLRFVSTLPLFHAPGVPRPDTYEVAKLNFSPPPEETTEHPLPMFNYPEAAPIRFDQEYNGDRIEITLQYERQVKPGEQPHIKVGFKTSSRRRIAALCLRITAHDNVVVDVQPRSREIGPKRKSEVVTTRGHERKRRRKAQAGGGFHQMAGLTLEGGGENTESYYTTESSTRSSTATIIGQPMRKYTDDDTADWNLNEAKTSFGGDGIKGYEGNGLSFSLLEMPHRFSYECWTTFVDSDGRERKYHKSSHGFWEKYAFQ